MVAEESAAVPAALMSTNSDCIMVRKNRPRSSVRLISQGLLRFASEGSMRTFSGGLEKTELSPTPDRDLRRLVVDHPGDAPGRVDAVGDAARGHEHVPEGYRYDLGLRRPLLEEPGEAPGVDRVQGRVDFVEHVERVGLDRLHREYEGDPGDGPLAPAELQGLGDPLVEGSHQGDPPGEDLLGVLQLEPRLPSGERPEDGVELRAHPLERREEDLSLLGLHALDEPDDRHPLALQLVVPDREALVVQVHVRVLPVGAPVHYAHDFLVLRFDLGQEGVAALEHLQLLRVAEHPYAPHGLVDPVLDGRNLPRQRREFLLVCGHRPRDRVPLLSEPPDLHVELVEDRLAPLRRYEDRLDPLLEVALLAGEVPYPLGG